MKPHAKPLSCKEERAFLCVFASLRASCGYPHVDKYKARTPFSLTHFSVNFAWRTIYPSSKFFNRLLKKEVKMTTQDVLKLNKAVIDSWNAHDAEKFLALCDESVVWKDSGNPKPFK